MIQIARNTFQSLPEENAEPPFLRRHFMQQDIALLQDLPAATLKQAWFTMAHLILDRGARVLHAGCGDGALTYAMAVMFPHYHFIGQDAAKTKIAFAKKKFSRSNLDFIAGDARGAFVPPASQDAVISNFHLHDIYSDTHCNENAVRNQIDAHYALLKDNGLFFIRDYAMPDPESFVILEMADDTQTGDISRLIEFSEKARARENPVHGGFFLEDLPPRFPRTRRFRLPHKWAYEFVIRKDSEHWERDIRTEYSFFTERDYRKTLRGLGARVLYTAPHWDQSQIARKFDRQFKLYDENGSPLGPPPTSFIALAQKVSGTASQILAERRPTRDQQSALKITAMRDEVEGKLIDVVSRDFSFSEIIPYCISADGKLQVYIHDGVPRALANTVPRLHSNLDGKKWSGHMIEAIAIDDTHVQTIKDFDRKSLVLFCRDHLGLKPAGHAQMQDGPALYPAPDYLDERIETRYIEVETEKNDFEPKALLPDADGFSGARAHP